ncbi:MAG: DUF935 domain-containing protein [Bacteroidetes bacterium]|nr:DUF935 domain-containing protein [Bacteroidota bacterium]
MVKNVLRSVTDTLRITKKDDLNRPETREVAVVGINDRYSSYPSKGLTPERLASLLQQADTGDVYAQSELFEEMLEKDGKLQGVFGDRRLAVTRRNYQIVAGGEDDKSLAIADDVKKLIDSIPNLDRVKGDILDAVPKGFSVSELFWQVRDTTYVLDRVRWKHQKKFRFGKVSDPLSDPEELRFVVDPSQIDQLRGIVSDEELANATTDGISLESNPRIRKRFAICYCQARSGHPARTSLLRTLAYLWLFKNWDVKWWVMFAERLLGIRIGKYDTNDPTQKDLLVSALRKLGQDTAAVISKDSEIEFVEWMQKAATHQVYGDVAEWVDDQYAVVALGHTGSSKSTPGKLGSEDSAKEVKLEIVEADAKALDTTFNDDIIRVYVDAVWGPQEVYPYMKTDVGRSLNLLTEVKIDRELQAIGFPITKQYVADKYGRPLPGPDDEVLTPIVAPSAPSTLGSDYSGMSLQGKKKLLRHR